MEQIFGTVAFLKIYKGSWGLASVKLDDGKVMRCVGAPVAGLKKGCAYQFNGHRTEHQTYGAQFDVEAVDGQSGAIKSAKPKKSSKTKSATVRRSKSSASHKWTSKRPRRRKASAVKDLDPPLPSCGNARMDRIAVSAYNFGKDYQVKNESVSLEQLDQAIYSHLCETTVWKELGKPCKIQASKAAEEIMSFVARKKSGIGPAKRYEDIAVILMYETAHHIGLHHLELEKNLDREKFVALVVAGLKKNEEAGSKKFPDSVSKAAAEHAANELLPITSKKSTRKKTSS